MKKILLTALIALLGIGCVKPNDDTPTPQPEESGKRYVKAIEFCGLNPETNELTSYEEFIEFDYDSKNRIVEIRGVEYDGTKVADLYTKINFNYNDDNNTLNIKANFDGETIDIDCELNERGAVETATYNMEDMTDITENFVYNDRGELTTYSMVYSGVILISLEYEWKDGNIVRISTPYEDEEYNSYAEFTYTTEENPYNVDLFYSYHSVMPLLCECILIHDGLLGNTNRSLLASYKECYYDEVYEECISHKFNSRGLVDYSMIDETDCMRYILL